MNSHSTKAVKSPDRKSQSENQLNKKAKLRINRDFTSAALDFDEERENDLLEMQLHQHIELGSHILPEFKELVSHGE